MKLLVSHDMDVSKRFPKICWECTVRRVAVGMVVLGTWGIRIGVVYSVAKVASFLILAM